MSQLNASVIFESQALRHSTVHKVLGQVQLQPSTDQCSESLDLFVAVDTSASMKQHLPMIQWMLRLMMNSLNENQRITFITFNHIPLIYTELLPYTEDKKEFISSRIDSLECEGSTSVLECLKAVKKILDKNDTKNRRAFIMITDGRHYMVQPNFIVKGITELAIPCPVHTFGIGLDQDSGLLFTLSHKTGGVYQNIQTSDQIPMVVTSLMDNLLTTCMTNVCVTLKCHKGARLVTLATPYKVEEKNLAKEYNVIIPSISRNQKKTIIFRLSLCQMKEPIKEHQLITVEISTDSPNQDHSTVQYGPFSVVRSVVTLLERIPIALDLNLNRYAVATAIIESIDLAEKQKFLEAVQKIKDTRNTTYCSVSGEDLLVIDMLKDLKACIHYVKNYQTFVLSGGVHALYMMASEYFMEYSRKIPLKWSYPTPQYTHVKALAYGENF